MKIICSLPEIHTYLKTKESDQNEKLVIIADGISFNKENRLSTLLQRVSLTPKQVKSLQLSLNSAESKDNDLEIDLKQLLKLDYSSIQFQLNVEQFTWNEKESSSISIFMRLLTEIMKEQKPKHLVLVISRDIKIEIYEQLAYVRIKMNKAVEKESVSICNQLVLLVKSMSKIIKQFDLTFKVESKLPYSYILQLILAIGSLSDVSKSILKIYWKADSIPALTYTDIFHFKKSHLLRADLTTCGPFSNLFTASTDLSDNGNVQLQLKNPSMKEAKLILKKLDKRLILNLDYNTQHQGHSVDQYSQNYQEQNMSLISNTLNSWNMFQLDNIQLNLNARILNLEICQGLSKVIGRQQKAQSVLIMLYYSQLVAEQDLQLYIAEILQPLEQLTQLHQLDFQLRAVDHLYNINSDKSFYSIATQFKLSHTINSITITLNNQSFETILQFTLLFQYPNITFISVTSDTSSYITLHDDVLSLDLPCKTNHQFKAIFSSLSEGIFNISKQLSLKVKLTFFELENNSCLDRGLFEISQQFTDISIQLNLPRIIPFELDFYEELENNRNYILKINNDVIFEKVNNERVWLAVNYIFTNYLFKLFPNQDENPPAQLIEVQNNLNENDAIVIDNDDNIIEKLVILIDNIENLNEKEVNQIAEKGKEVSANNLMEQNSQINNQKQKMIKKFRSLKRNKEEVSYPLRYKSILKIIEKMSDYKFCSIDFSNALCPELISNFLLQKFQFSENVAINLSSNQLTDKDIIQFREFFFSLGKTIKSISLNMSDNVNLHNQGAVNLFYSLSSLKNSLTCLDLNLSKTSIKKRGIISLCLKIKQLSHLKVLRLDISNSFNRNEFNLVAIQKIFQLSSEQYLPHIEEFCFKASTTVIHLDSQFYSIIGKSLPLISKQLKILKLNFKNNIYSACSINPFLNSLKKLPEGLTKLSLNFGQIQNYTQDHLFSFNSIPYYIKHLKLNSFSLKTGQYIDDTICVKKYAEMLIKNIQCINLDSMIKMKIDIYDFEMKIKDNKLIFDKSISMLKFLKQLPLDSQKSFMDNLSQYLINISPHIQQNQTELQQIFWRFESAYF